MTVPKKGKDRRRARTEVVQLENLQKEITAAKKIATEKILAEDKDKGPHCSFCGKSQSYVKKLISGGSAVICNECIDIFNEIMADDQQAATH